MTEALITTTYPYCEYGLAMVVIGLNERESYKSIRISIDGINFIKADIDPEYSHRTTPVLFKKLEIGRLYKILAKLERSSGEVDVIESTFQPVCSEASFPEPLISQKTYPFGGAVERKVTFCLEQ